MTARVRPTPLALGSARCCAGVEGWPARADEGALVGVAELVVAHGLGLSSPAETDGLGAEVSPRVGDGLGVSVELVVGLGLGVGVGVEEGAGLLVTASGLGEPAGVGVSA